MLTQKYRSESDLVIRLLFGFEEVVVQVTDTCADYKHCTGLAGCLYGVIFNTSHYFFVIVKSLMELIRFIYYLIMHNFVLMRAFVEESGGQHFFLNIDIYPIYFD